MPKSTNNPAALPHMTTAAPHAATDIGSLEKEIREWVSGQNRTIDQFFSIFPRLDNNSNSNTDGDISTKNTDKGVEISSGVAWTVVAPLVLLGVFFVIGAFLLCLWRLRWRHRTSSEAESDDGDIDNARRGVTSGGDVEMMELPAGRHANGNRPPSRDTGRNPNDPLGIAMAYNGTLTRSSSRASHARWKKVGGGAADGALQEGTVQLSMPHDYSSINPPTSSTHPDKSAKVKAIIHSSTPHGHQPGVKEELFQKVIRLPHPHPLHDLYLHEKCGDLKSQGEPKGHTDLGPYFNPFNPRAPSSQLSGGQYGAKWENDYCHCVHCQHYEQPRVLQQFQQARLQNEDYQQCQQCQCQQTRWPPPPDRCQCCVHHDVPPQPAVQEIYHHQHTHNDHGYLTLGKTVFPLGMNHEHGAKPVVHTDHLHNGQVYSRHAHGHTGHGAGHNGHQGLGLTGKHTHNAHGQAGHSAPGHTGHDNQGPKERERSALHHGHHHHPHPESPQQTHHAGKLLHVQHGVENPSFTAEHDDDLVTDSFRSVSLPCVGDSGQSPGTRLDTSSTGGDGEQGHIINSTSVLSSIRSAPDLDNNSAPSRPPVHSTRQHHGHHVTKSPLVEGPDVSSIKIVCSASAAWRQSSRHLPSPQSSTTDHAHNTTPNTTTTTSDSHNDKEESISLPSSISRFHASKARSPVLPPDAVYPLASTYNGMFPTANNTAELAGNLSDGPINDSRRGHVNVTSRGSLAMSDQFSDNTSMFPNVGSSVTSGQASDVKGSQPHSSTASEPMEVVQRPHTTQPPRIHQPGTVGRTQTKTEPRQGTRKEKQTRKEALTLNLEPAQGGEGTHRHGDYVDMNIVKAHVDKKPPQGKKTSPPSFEGKDRSSLSPPLSAAELNRGKGKTCFEFPKSSKSHKKHGYCLIPGDSDAEQDAKFYDCRSPFIMDKDPDVDTQTQDEKNSAQQQPLNSDGGFTRTASTRLSTLSKAKRLKLAVAAKPAQRPGSPYVGPMTADPRMPSPKTHVDRFKSSTKPKPVDGKSRKQIPEARRQTVQTSKRDMPDGAGNSHDRQAVNQFSPTAASNGGRSGAKWVKTQGKQQPPSPEDITLTKQTDGPDKTARDTQHHDRDMTPDYGKYQPKGRTPKDACHQFTGKTSDHAQRPSEGRTPNETEGLSKDNTPRNSLQQVTHIKSSGRAKSKEKKGKRQDHVYVNMGGSFQDEEHIVLDDAADPQRTTLTGQSVGSNTRQGSADHQDVKVDNSTAWSTDLPIHADTFPGTKTDAEILADVFSSFPTDSRLAAPGYGTSLTFTSVSGPSGAGVVPNSSDTRLDGIGTIPSAFADELFGIWTLSPEIDFETDLSLSRPRTPLMTPLKEEARKATAKFIWGTSNTPSASTSTSSFAAVWTNAGDDRHHPRAILGTVDDQQHHPRGRAVWATVEDRHNSRAILGTVDDRQHTGTRQGHLHPQARHRAEAAGGLTHHATGFKAEISDRLNRLKAHDLLRLADPRPLTPEDVEFADYVEFDAQSSSGNQGEGSSGQAGDSGRGFRDGRGKRLVAGDSSSGVASDGRLGYNGPDSSTGPDSSHSAQHLMHDEGSRSPEGEDDDPIQMTNLNYSRIYNLCGSIDNDDVNNNTVPSADYSHDSEAGGGRVMAGHTQQLSAMTGGTDVTTRRQSGDPELTPVVRSPVLARKQYWF